MKTQIWLCLLSALASTLTAQAAIVPAPDDQEEPAVVANGNSYFVVWADKGTYDDTEYDIYGALVRGTGDVSPRNGFLISGPQSNAPPTVTIINPREGDTFTAPANIFLLASVHDEDGIAAEATVEFLDGANRFGIGQLTDPGP